MNRLTKKLTQEDIDEMKRFCKEQGLQVVPHDKVGDYTLGKSVWRDNSPMVKLGELEDIEEELGVDLIKLLRARKIYVMDYGKPYLTWSPSVNFKTNKIYTIDETTRTICGQYDIKDYGTTWAFTKEELE